MSSVITGCWGCCLGERSAQGEFVRAGAWIGAGYCGKGLQIRGRDSDGGYAAAVFSGLDEELRRLKRR